MQALSFSTPAFGRGGDQTGMVIIQLTDWAERYPRLDPTLALEAFGGVRPTPYTRTSILSAPTIRALS